MSPATKSSTVLETQRAALRLKCQTDLFFLCHDVLGYTDMVPHVHQKICDTYVQKHPDVAIFDLEQVKTSLVLAPRGIFKTCIDIGDVVQWILCYPNIRILILTGSQELAWRMVREVKDHFRTNEVLRELFPDLCPEREGRWGSDDEFTSPGRTANLREPTVSSSTIASVKNGGHYEVIKPDDIQNEINSSTPDQCNKVVESFDGLTYLLEPGGFIELNGTRYKPWDLYGVLLKRAADAAALAAKESHEDDEEDSDPYVQDMRTCILGAWALKPGVVPVPDEHNVPIISKRMVNLLFPERLKFRSLLKQYRANPTLFSCQMLNDPDTIISVARPFTEALINSHTVPFNQLPQPSNGTTHLYWDLAGAKPAEDGSSDFVVGVAARRDKTGRLFIVDGHRGHWNAHQQAAQIVALQKDYPEAEFTHIEDAIGARFLEPTILRIAATCGVKIRIKWSKVPRFSGAKRIRIDDMAALLKADKLWFAAHLEFIDQLKSELIDLRPAHDDCSDAIAMLCRELRMDTGLAPGESLPLTTRKEVRDRAFERAIFGDDDPPPSQPQPTYGAGVLGYGMGR